MKNKQGMSDRNSWTTDYTCILYMLHKSSKINLLFANNVANKMFALFFKKINFALNFKRKLLLESK